MPKPASTDEQRQAQISSRPWLVMLLVLVVFLFAAPAIFVYPVERILFNPAVYKSAFVSLQVYDRYPEVLADLLARQGETILPGSGRVFERMLDRAGYQASILQVFPPAWARAQTESLLDQLLAYYNLQTTELSLVVDFRPVKQRLGGDEGAEIASTIVAGFPPCSVEELLVFGLNALQGQLAEVPLCRPPDQFLGITTGIVQAVLRGSAATIPNQADFARILRLPLLLGGERLEAALGGWFWLYRTYRKASPWLLPLALVSLAVTAVLARGTRQGAAFWCGLALLLPGLAGLAVTGWITWFSGRGAPLLLARIFPSDLLVSELLLGVYQSVMGQFTTASVIIAAAFIAAGGLLIGWHTYMKRRQPVADG